MINPEELPELAADSVTRTLKPATWLPYLALAGLLFMQLVSPDRAWSWLLVGLGVMWVTSYVWARILRDQVSGSRQVLGTWVVAGDQIRENFTLTNSGNLPVLWAHVKDGSAVPGYRADRVESVGARSERMWSGTGVCQRRGLFRLGPWDLLMSDPLGFFEVRHHYSATTTLMPLRPADGSVRAKIRQTSATPPLVTKTLLALMV